MVNPADKPSEKAAPGNTEVLTTTGIPGGREIRSVPEKKPDAEAPKEVVVPEKKPDAEVRVIPAEKKPEEKPEPGKGPTAAVSAILTDDSVQINVLVPKTIKDKAQAEANLAAEYGWISSPKLTQYFIWLVDKYMFKVMKRAAAQRRSEVAATEKE